MEGEAAFERLLDSRVLLDDMVLVDIRDPRGRLEYGVLPLLVSSKKVAVLRRSSTEANSSSNGTASSSSSSLGKISPLELNESEVTPDSFVELLCLRWAKYAGYSSASSINGACSSSDLRDAPGWS